MTSPEAADLKVTIMICPRCIGGIEPENTPPCHGVDAGEPCELVIQHLARVVLNPPALNGLLDVRQRQSHEIAVATVGPQEPEGVCGRKGLRFLRLNFLRCRHGGSEPFFPLKISTGLSVRL